MSLQWTAYARHEDGRTLECAVTYNHATRGDWYWRLMTPDGRTTTCRAPRGRLGRGWQYTADGLMIIDDRRAGLM